MGADRPVKWIANYDNEFKGPMPIRQALAESRNAVAVWITREIGLDKVISTSREMGIRTPLQPYITTALGASEVRLLELAGAYRAMASGLLAEPYIIDRVTDASGAALYQASADTVAIDSTYLSLIQEGLRGVIRLPEGTAHALDSRDFPIPVMGKTGTTSEFRDALFVGSTYGPQGITVAVRVGFDDNRALGEKETGGRTALPIFREIMLRVYERQLVGPVPEFPREIEHRIDQYLARQANGIRTGAPDPASLDGRRRAPSVASLAVSDPIQNPPARVLTLDPLGLLEQAQPAPRLAGGVLKDERGPRQRHRRGGSRRLDAVMGQSTPALVVELDLPLHGVEPERAVTGARHSMRCPLMASAPPTPPTTPIAIMPGGTELMSHAIAPTARPPASPVTRSPSSP
jgi:membrane peptidoglycan carboxypeptidase